MKTLLALLPMCVLMLVSACVAQTDTGSASGALYGIPYVYYTPETDWAFGGTGVLTFRPGNDRSLNPSSLTLDAYYTIKKQFKTSLIGELFFNENQLYLLGSIEYGRIVDKFWGIGPFTEDSDSTEYVKGNFRFTGRVQRILLGRLKVGILMEFDRTWMIDKENNSLLSEGEVTGSSGGTSSGLGVAFSWDSRDIIFFPTGGSYHQFEYTVFGQYLGSDYAFQRAILDLRAYYDIGGNHIIAFQGGGMIVGGNPPFYKLAPLGGDGIMRGYYLGRYRDKVYVAAQAEYRKMFLPRFGAVAFLGAGEVAPALSALEMNTLKPSYGGGLRFVLDTKDQLTLRLDIGFGQGTSGVYLAVREAF